MGRSRYLDQGLRCNMNEWFHRHRLGGLLVLLMGASPTITVVTCDQPRQGPGQLFVASSNDDLFEDVFEVFFEDDDDDFEDFLDDVDDMFHH